MTSTIVALSGNARVSTIDKSRDGIQRQYLTSRRRLVMESSVLSLLLVQETPAAAWSGEDGTDACSERQELRKDAHRYKDLVFGKQADIATVGSKVVVDWSGVTLGYYGRIFEARNKAKGGHLQGMKRSFLDSHGG
eukprot:jgi/Picre1/34671/NNA_002139.t1